MTGDRGAIEVQSPTTEPATPERWSDVVLAFGNRGKDPEWCWCRRFLAEAEDDLVPVSNRRALEIEILNADIAPGIIAYVGGDPVGWTRIMPRAALPGVRRNRALRRMLVDDPDAWWVACFAVNQHHRRAGVAASLLEAAVDHARLNGASAVEGHPVDTNALKADKVSGSALFTGTMATFVAAGSRRWVGPFRRGPSCVWTFDVARNRSGLRCLHSLRESRSGHRALQRGYRRTSRSCTRMEPFPRPER